MTSFTLEPRSQEARYQFELEGESPPSVMQGFVSLGWKVRIKEINAVESRTPGGTLTSGGKLLDLKGGVSFHIGTATPLGKSVYNKVPIWGYFTYRSSPDEHFTAGLHVSERMFRSLVELAKNGAIPTVDIALVEDDSLTESLPEGRLDEWDNVTTPSLEIAWCNFDVTLPGGNARSSGV